MSQKIEYIECSCKWAEHSLRFVFDDDGTLYTEVHLTKAPWYKRLIKAIAYILGKRSKYGCYDCTIIDKNDYDRLIDLFLKAKNFKG